jgi:hypothetical protein
MYINLHLINFAEVALEVYTIYYIRTLYIAHMKYS